MTTSDMTWLTLKLLYFVNACMCAAAQIVTHATWIFLVVIVVRVWLNIFNVGFF